MSVLKRGMPQNPKDPPLIPPTLRHISYDERRARSRVTAHQISPLLGNVTLRRPHIVSYPPVVCPLRNKSCDNSTPSHDPGQRRNRVIIRPRPVLLRTAWATQAATQPGPA